VYPKGADGTGTEPVKIGVVQEQHAKAQCGSLGAGGLLEGGCHGGAVVVHEGEDVVVVGQNHGAGGLVGKVAELERRARNSLQAEGAEGGV
jgi:hypothetical protein